MAYLRRLHFIQFYACIPVAGCVIIIADRHGENHHIRKRNVGLIKPSLSEKENRHAQTKRHRKRISEHRAMKKITVRDKTHIKQLLYDEWVLGIKDDQFRSFGGFQLWWFDKQHGVCDCCESHWSDPRKKVIHYNLDRAAKILWRNRHRLFVRTKHVSDDRRLLMLEHLDEVVQ